MRAGRVGGVPTLGCLWAGVGGKRFGFLGGDSGEGSRRLGMGKWAGISNKSRSYATVNKDDRGRCEPGRCEPRPASVHGSAVPVRGFLRRPLCFM
eukprot:scaffold21502_cov56-Isochrysis_galbana.AAC.1